MTSQLLTLRRGAAGRPAFLDAPDRNCLGKTWLFYPTTDAPHHIETAVAVCRTCPHLTACDAHATASGETEGVWGGRWRGRNRNAYMRAWRAKQETR